MSEFHEDSKCAACSGPLEVSRDAVCEKCVPESVYFEQMAAEQESRDRTVPGKIGRDYWTGNYFRFTDYRRA